ncbi:MAG: integrase core domain-containing protein [Flavobacteriales bacterium]
MKKAIKERNEENIRGLIFHSDGGGQYYCKEFLTLTKAQGIKNSMAENVYENPHAERIHRTIKDDYLYQYAPQNFQQLDKMTTKAIYLYNEEKPHSALKGKHPMSVNLSKVGFQQKSRFLTKKKRKVIIVIKRSSLFRNVHFGRQNCQP